MSKYANKIQVPTGSDFKTASLGEHPAIILGMAFLPTYIKDFNGNKKEPCINVMLRYKLFDMDEESGEIKVSEAPYITSIIPFKWHELATYTKMMAKLFPKSCTIKEKPDDEMFDKLIDNLPNKFCTVDIVQDGKKKNEDGSPAYVKVGATSAMNALVKNNMPEHDTEEAVGILMEDEITPQILKQWLASYEAERYVIDTPEYSNSVFPALIEAIRSEEGNEDYGKPSKKEGSPDGKPSDSPKPDKPQQSPVKDDEAETDNTVASDLDAEEEF